VEDDHEDTDPLLELGDDEVWIDKKSLTGLTIRIAEFDCE